MHWTRLTLALIAVGLAGCASNGPSSALAEGPRMIDLYRGTAGTVGETGVGRLRDEAPERRCGWWIFTRPCDALEGGMETCDRDPGPDATAYAHTASNELELLFPRLPNPDVYIHVLPHLATDQRVPVPGYTTAVPLYERVEYALPGEEERAMRLLEPGVAEERGGASDALAVPDGGDAP